MENQDFTFQKLQLDYQQTMDQFKMLADSRFKLLAFVPVLAAAAITFCPSVDSMLWHCRSEF